jgi:1-deoxy-D-xylulose-5-phosphate reductoisomerase
VVQQARRTPGAELIPVDSEHGALHQCLRSGGYVDAGVPRRVARLLLTASGGPFRGRTRAELEAVTVDDALAHPTWSMGPKITVDSSTLMNKGLEVIEANELFGEPAGEAGVGISLDQIDVVVHPQSIVHSMVEYTDASTIAQLSLPDMRLPIGYALAWPDRLGTPFGHIDWANLGRLDFEPPDLATFGCLSLAFEAARIGGTAPAWLNAANEVVVAAFLAGRVPWVAISEVLSEALTRHDGSSASSVEAVVDVDRRARLDTTELLARWDRR